MRFLLHTVTGLIVCPYPCTRVCFNFNTIEDTDIEIN